MKQLVYRLLSFILFITLVFSCTLLKKENKDSVTMSAPEEIGDTNEIYEEEKIK